MPVESNLKEGDRWTFDSEVAGSFDEMLRRSIPQYEVMRKLTYELACPFVKPQTTVLDLGCSRGEALVPFVHRFGAQNRFVGIDVSEPMLAAARERFQGYINCGVVDIRATDLRTEFPEETCSVILSVLTLQFTPIEYRPRILAEIHDHLIPGGALMLVEKVVGETKTTDALITGRYLQFKSEQGYTHEEIERKRLSLEGVLVPMTARFNEDMLKSAGFRSVECFWRWGPFVGWVALK